MEAPGSLPAPKRASMRPWRFATDNADIEALDAQIDRGFNEAVAFCHG